jgi:hypothetical protein
VMLLIDESSLTLPYGISGIDNAYCLDK